MRRVRFLPGVLLLGLVMALDPSLASAQEAGKTIVKRGVIPEDLYVAGGRLNILAEVQGDVVAVGGQITIGRLVKGDVIVAGGDVTVTGQVLDDVRAAGGAVAINGEIGGDVISAGGSVSIPTETKVGGRAWLAGRTVEVRGRIGKELKAAARRISLSGEVEGDANLAASEIEILSTARIKGDLTYRSPREAKIDPDAQIEGGVTHHRIDFVGKAARARGVIIGTGWILAVVGLMAAGVVLFLLFPNFTVSAARTIQTDLWKSLGLGFALLISAPVAGVILMMTVVGIPLGAMLFALYFVLLLVAFLTAALFLGELGARAFRRGPELAKGWRVLSLLVALIVLGLLSLIPVAGSLILFLALLFSLGAWAVHGYRTYAGTQ
ncbi:MAG: hypothetical protein ACE5FK_01675 [Candidatus Methylomirabilia bacterium]